MTPIRMFEGTRRLDGVDELGHGEGAVDSIARRNLLERRFAALAAAVRDHEARVSRLISGARPCDVTLYRRMRQILADDGRRR